jgi:hypothetical protein
VRFWRSCTLSSAVKSSSGREVMTFFMCS